MAPAPPAPRAHPPTPAHKHTCTHYPLPATALISREVLEEELRRLRQAIEAEEAVLAAQRQQQQLQQQEQLDGKAVAAGGGGGGGGGASAVAVPSSSSSSAAAADADADAAAPKEVVAEAAEVAAGAAAVDSLDSFMASMDTQLERDKVGWSVGWFADCLLPGPRPPPPRHSTKGS